MDKDRIKGSAKQAKGAVKEAIGKVTGDAKLETEGKRDKAAGKISERGWRPQRHASRQIEIPLRLRTFWAFSIPFKGAMNVPPLIFYAAELAPTAIILF